jgi:hypothetical protein
MLISSLEATRSRRQETTSMSFQLGSTRLGSQGGTMTVTGSSQKPTTRRYTPEEKEQAVRMVRTLRAELGTSQGTVKRVVCPSAVGVVWHADPAVGQCAQGFVVGVAGGAAAVVERARAGGGLQ